jgi:hypothetical protein
MSVLKNYPFRSSVDHGVAYVIRMTIQVHFDKEFKIAIFSSNKIGPSPTLSSTNQHKSDDRAFAQTQLKTPCE